MKNNRGNVKTYSNFIINFAVKAKLENFFFNFHASRLQVINDCISFTFFSIYFQITISNSETMKYFNGWKMEFVHLLLYLVSLLLCKWAVSPTSSTYRITHWMVFANNLRRLVKLLLALFLFDYVNVCSSYSKV